MATRPRVCYPERRTRSAVSSIGTTILLLATSLPIRVSEQWGPQPRRCCRRGQRCTPRPNGQALKYHSSAYIASFARKSDSPRGTLSAHLLPTRNERCDQPEKRRRRRKDQRGTGRRRGRPATAPPRKWPCLDTAPRFSAMRMEAPFSREGMGEIRSPAHPSTYPTKTFRESESLSFFDTATSFRRP